MGNLKFDTPLDAFVVYTAARDDLIKDEIDWELLISVGLVVLFAILINYRLARKLNNIIRFYVPICICLLNTVIFIVFERNTGNLWSEFFGYEKTAPYTVDGFGAALYYSNIDFMFDFVVKNILFLIITIISLIIVKKKRLDLCT